VAGAMTDSLTVLHTRGPLATKRFYIDDQGTIAKSGYGNACYFRVESRAVADIHELSAALMDLQDNRRALVVRGELLPGIDPVNVRRLLKVKFDKDGTRHEPVFGASPRRWLHLDMDGLPCPPGIAPAANPDAAIQTLIARLPAEFRAATCHWQFSSSQGFKGDGLSAHLWYWLDREIPDNDLKMWAVEVNATAGCKLIDPCVMEPVQPNYTAAPVFEGVPDPLPVRSGLRQGQIDEVTLILPERGTAPRRNGFDGHLAAIGGPNGFLEPMKAACASGIAHGMPHDAIKARVAATARDRDPGGGRTADVERYIGDLDSILDTIEGLERAKRNGADAPAGGRGPVIDHVPGQLPREIREAAAALLTHSAGPAIYQRAGMLCRVARLDKATDDDGIRRPAGSLTIVNLEADWLELHLSRAARWRRFDERKGDWAAIDAPAKVARGLLADLGNWPFPTLRAVIETPTLRPDGSILDSPGYDAASGLLFDPGGADFGSIPANPSRDDALQALVELRGVLKGFPFSDGIDAEGRDAVTAGGISRSVTLAALFTALVRAALRTAPLFGKTAPTMGSGKSLLADVISIIATGRTAPAMSYTDDPAEERKRLTAALSSGTPLILIDNVEAPMQSDALCSILTQQIYRDRILGQTRTVELPTCCTVLVTGNNLVIRGDLATRALLSQLDARCERPDERQFDVDLYDEVPRIRPQLVRAILTILRAYVVAGRPPVAAKPYGRFEDWSATIRAPLLWLGLHDPCGSRAWVVDADPVDATLGCLLTAWEAAFGTAPATVADAVDASKKTGTEADNLKAALDPFLFKGEPDPRRIGAFIAKHKGRVRTGLTFQPLGKTGHRIRWRTTPTR